MSTLAELMAPVRHVLLDFDGPVCSVFGNLPAPEVARRLAAAIDEDMPAENTGTDPLALLSVFAQRDHEVLVATEAKLRELEVEAVLSAPITPGVVEALQAFHDTGRAVTIVSNNSAAAVRRFLDDHHLDHLVKRVCSRELSEPALLKPSPHLLQQAITQQGSEPVECLMIGDSATDILSARAAAVAIVGLANRTSKRRTFRELGLSSYQIIENMVELARPLIKVAGYAKS